MNGTYVAIHNLLGRQTFVDTVAPRGQTGRWLARTNRAGETIERGYRLSDDGKCITVMHLHIGQAVSDHAPCYIRGNIVAWIVKE